MKSFKKLFAIVATAAMLSTLVQTSAFAAGYSDELQGAYDYAYGMGITTQSSIDSANMYGSLIRSHMAKMMVEYAKEMGKTADTSVEVNFSDIADQSSDLQGYIEEAAQMGLMGLNSDGSVAAKFNPTGVVTRAQFGTVLSRVLYGDANNGSEPYYAAHLEALQEAGVMTKIDTPNATEVRGYVMLMMQRADEGTSETPATCSTAENILACTLGTSACPTECQETVVEETKAGSLNVSLNSDSPAKGTEVPKAGTIRFAVVDFKAGSDDVSLKTVELKKVGLSTIPSSTRIWFEKDGIRVSGKAAFSSEGTAVVSFAPAYAVKGGETASLDLYVELNADSAQDFQFASSSVDSTAEDVNGSFTTAALRTANYSVASVALSGASSASTYNASADAVELGAFKLTNTKPIGISETRDVDFKSITLRQNGNGDLSSLSDIVLVRNGSTVAKNPIINGKDITFSVNDTIKDSTAATYYIKAVVDTVDYSAGDTYQFGIRYTSDVNVAEVNTAFRTTVTTDANLSTYTVKGGDITFTKDSSIELASNYAAGTTEVVLMKGTISAKNALTLEDVTLTPSVTGVNLANLFSTIYLKIGSSTFSYSPASGDTVASFLGTATVNGSASVKMYGTLKDTAPATSVKFSDLKLGSFAKAEYVSNSNAVSSSVGAIAGVNVTVQASALNVTKNDALGNQNISAGTKDLLVYGLKLSSDQGNGVAISNAKFDIVSSNTGKLYNNAYLTLYVNGAAVASKTIQGTTVSFDSFNAKVTKTSPVTLEVKADLNDAFDAGSLQVTLNSITAVDSLTSADVTPSAKPAGATFTVATAAGTIASSDLNPKAQLLLSPSTAVKLLAFKLTAANDDVKIYDVNFTGTSLDALSNFAIVDASGATVATANSATATALTFTQIANAPKVMKDKSATYYVVADVNSNTTTGTIALTLTSSTIKASNGSVIAATGVVASKTHATAENTLVVAKAANSSKLLTTSALRFTVTAAGKNSITLSGVVLNNSIAGYTGTATLAVYKDSVSAGNLAGSLSAKTGTVSFNANQTVDAGNTVTYIVAVEGLTSDASVPGNQDWSVSLTNVLFGSMGAASYDNVASFPITEVK